MKEIALHHSEVIQGTFVPRALNLLFVFQVNCPACFVHGIPSVNKLKDTFQDRLPILGLSTAFEDFEINTRANTENLVQDGHPVGETASYFERNPKAKVPEISFPVSFDELTSGTAFVNDDSIDHILQLHQQGEGWTPERTKAVRSRIHQYYLSQPIVPKSFTLNQWRGTPCFVFFNDRRKVILEHFGALDERRLLEWLVLQLNEVNG